MVKVKRTFPAPASLEIESKKRTGSYEKPDVIRQLRDDFHNKCYICEMKNLQDPEVEHLLPHKNGKYWAGSLTGIIFSGHAATATVLKTKRSMIWES